jgi:hypothetical protein
MALFTQSSVRMTEHAQVTLLDEYPCSFHTNLLGKRLLMGWKYVACGFFRYNMIKEKTHNCNSGGTSVFRFRGITFEGFLWLNLYLACKYAIWNHRSNSITAVINLSSFAPFTYLGVICLPWSVIGRILPGLNVALEILL